MERTFKKYEDLQFSDDFMFWKVMTEYEDICRKVVELCIGRKVSEIKYKSGQQIMEISPESRGIRLDVYLEECGTGRLTGQCMTSRCRQ